MRTLEYITDVYKRQSADNDIPVYTDPSANGFSDGEKDDFNSGKNDMPELSPTPTPALEDHCLLYTSQRFQQHVDVRINL